MSQRIKRTAFTLIELAAVVALIALLTGVAIVKLGGPLRKATYESALQRIVALDQQTRFRAQAAQPGRIFIDLEACELVSFAGRADSQPANQVFLPPGFSIDEVVTRSRRCADGSMEILIGPLGNSPTYAMKVSNSRELSRWLLFMGRTGQFVYLESDDQVLALISPGR